MTDKKNDPNWAIAEPVLFDIWKFAFETASFEDKVVAYIVAILANVIGFVASLLFRSLLIASLFFICYLLSRQTFSYIIKSVLPTLPIFDTITIRSGTYPDFWIYQLLGYILLIKTTLYIFGKNLSAFLKHSLLTLKGFRNRSYFKVLAQNYAELNVYGFICMFVHQNIFREAHRLEWDKIIGQYWHEYWQVQPDQNDLVALIAAYLRGENRRLWLTRSPKPGEPNYLDWANKSGRWRGR